MNQTLANNTIPVCVDLERMLQKSYLNIASGTQLGLHNQILCNDIYRNHFAGIQSAYSRLNLLTRSNLILLGFE